MLPAEEIAETTSPRRLLNMVILGALLDKLPILTLADIKIALNAQMPKRHKKYFKSNVKALDKGSAFTRGEFTFNNPTNTSQEPIKTIAPTSV
jgi:Pyruvate/2-oxoacid:ferredoxin oxidoreductase gamma subunit